MIIILFHIILHYFLLKIHLDKGFDKDMHILIVTCIDCDWSGQLKTYQVLAIY